jgi:hypothetical protein
LTETAADRPAGGPRNSIAADETIVTLAQVHRYQSKTLVLRRRNDKARARRAALDRTQIK